MSGQNAVQKFFTALAEKNLDKALESVHEDAVFSSPPALRPCLYTATFSANPVS